MRVIKAALVALVLSVGFAAPVGAGQFEDGFAAYKRGDYATAFRLWRPLADQGIAGAQYNLGLMYANGWGVPQDYVASAKWYRMAADQGIAAAQNNLGVMYRDGQGVPQDYVEAHMWLNLSASASASKERDKAVKTRDMVADRMTPAQLAEAQKLAREWRPASER